MNDKCKQKKSITAVYMQMHGIENLYVLNKQYIHKKISF